MRTFKVLLPVTIVTLLAHGRGLSPGEARHEIRGEQLFHERCAICHTREDAAPSLAGILGRKAGTVGFDYSPVLTKSDLIWTEKNLEEFLAHPRTFLPGNRMGFFGLPEAADRQDIITYLSRL